MAGCSGSPVAEPEAAVSPIAVTSDTPASPALAAAEVELPVPKNRLELAGFKDSIPAMMEPAYADDWRDVRIGLQQQGLSSDFDCQFEPPRSVETSVIGVERREIGRAYPLGVLNGWRSSTTCFWWPRYLVSRHW
jgi:hypothetical protein